MDFSLASLLVIGTTAVIQSVFGIGVLLFGTPWLLVLGIDFGDALWTLLPASLSISLLQLARGRQSVDWETARGLVVWTLPSVAIALSVATLFRPSVELVVAGVVLAVAAMDHSRRVRVAVRHLMGHRKTYLVLMGLLHGTSNLGGSLLAAWEYARFQTRGIASATIAVGYALFASVQLLTLWVTRVPGSRGAAGTLGVVALAATIFVTVESLTAHRIQADRYRAGLSALLVCTGCVLFVRAVLF